MNKETLFGLSIIGMFVFYLLMGCFTYAWVYNRGCANHSIEPIKPYYLTTTRSECSFGRGISWPFYWPTTFFFHITTP